MARRRAGFATGDHGEAGGRRDSTGRELTGDVQRFVTGFPDELNHGLSKSKVRARELVDRTKENIGTRLEERTQRKRALRMAEAKRREELEAGGYDY